MELIHRAGTCEDGTCPNVWDVTGDGTEGMAAIRGTTLTDPGALAQLSLMPPHESMLLVPRRLLLEYADRVRAESRDDDA
jgi:hypothetical protein